MKRFFAGSIALAFAIVACNDMATEPISLSPDALTDLGIASTSLAWAGHGGDNLPCDGYHWVLANHGGGDEVPTIHFYAGDPGDEMWRPSDNDDPASTASWHYDYEGIEEPVVGQYPYVVYPGADLSGAILTISNCLDVDNPNLLVTKDADTEFVRTHEWDIDKKVETDNEKFVNGTPKVWLYTDGSGDETAEWTVDVTYVGSEDSDFVIFGSIQITNISAGTQTVASIVDDLGVTGYDDIALVCEDGANNEFDPSTALPRDITSGETWNCDYRVELLEGEAEEGDSGTNTVTVTTDAGDPYSPYIATDGWEFDAPTTVNYATVNIEDVSDLTALGLNGVQDLGSVTAPNGDSFTYDWDFAYEDYGQAQCGPHQYDNTATIVETGQDADATLKVNVECLIFEGETAWASNLLDQPLQLRYTQRGNWATYVEYEANKTTTLYAGQTTDVGTVHFSAVSGGMVDITVTLTGDWEFEDVAENLKVQDYATAPSGNPSPGQFDHKKDCDATSNVCVITVPENNFYGVHVNVGAWVPDPDFGA